MPSGVDTAYLLATYLGGIATRLPQLREPGCEIVMTEAIEEAEWNVRRDISTRFDVTHFVPDLSANAQTDLDQTGGPQEYESLYQWPGVGPGDGFPRIKPKIRPIQRIVSLKLNMPGTIISNFEFPLDWLRVDRKAHEIVIAPTGGNAVYALAHAMGGLGWRTPQTAALDYYAGMPTGSDDWPQLKRLVAIRATLQLLPILSGWLNPTALSSISADGLTQSRKSGFIFADWADKLDKDAENMTNDLLAAWDGPGLFVL